MLGREPEHRRIDGTVASRRHLTSGPLSDCAGRRIVPLLIYAFRTSALSQIVRCRLRTYLAPHPASESLVGFKVLALRHVLDTLPQSALKEENYVQATVEKKTKLFFRYLPC